MNARARTGTGGLNVPMFIALRRFTLLATIVLERLMYKRRHDRSTYGAVATMIIGPPLLRIGASNDSKGRAQLRAMHAAAAV